MFVRAGEELKPATNVVATGFPLMFEADVRQTHLNGLQF